MSRDCPERPELTLADLPFAQFKVDRSQVLEQPQIVALMRRSDSSADLASEADALLAAQRLRQSTQQPQLQSTQPMAPPAQHLYPSIKSETENLEGIEPARKMAPLKTGSVYHLLISWQQARLPERDFAGRPMP